MPLPLSCLILIPQPATYFAVTTRMLPYGSQGGGAVTRENRRGRTHAFTVVAGAFQRRSTVGHWHGTGAGRRAPPGVGPRAQRPAWRHLRLRQALRQVRGRRLP